MKVFFCAMGGLTQREDPRNETNKESRNKLEAPGKELKGQNRAHEGHSVRAKHNRGEGQQKDQQTWPLIEPKAECQKH